MNGMQYYTVSYKVKGYLVQSKVYGFERALHTAAKIRQRGFRCLVDVTQGNQYQRACAI
jgi:hypothetical protein